MVEYLRRNTTGSIYPAGSPTAIVIVYVQLPPRSWSTTIIRCQHDKGSAIIITISQHDTESTILDPPLRFLIRNPHELKDHIEKSLFPELLQRLC